MLSCIFFGIHFPPSLMNPIVDHKILFFFFFSSLFFLLFIFFLFLLKSKKPWSSFNLTYNYNQFPGIFSVFSSNFSFLNQDPALLSRQLPQVRWGWPDNVWQPWPGSPLSRPWRPSPGTAGRSSASPPQGSPQNRSPSHLHRENLYNPVPVMWIRIQIVSVFRNFVGPYSEYRSGSAQVKIDCRNKITIQRKPTNN